MESKPDRDRAPELVVEKLALGEASAQQQRLVTDADKRRADELHRDNAEILARYPAHKLAAQIRHRAAAAAPLPARRWLWAPALATALGVLVVGVGSGYLGELGPGRGHTAGSGAPESGDAVRIKGSGPRILVFRKQGDKAAQLRPGAEAQAGDLIQLGYLASGQRYGVIVSIDARGGATLHFPATAAASTELARSGPAMLDQAFQLDDSPAFERFFLVTADQGNEAALSVALVMDKARALAADARAAETGMLALAPSLQQQSFLLRKKTP